MYDEEEGERNLIQAYNRQKEDYNQKKRSKKAMHGVDGLFHMCSSLSKKQRQIL